MEAPLLYITLNGLTEPLGQSQVLEYMLEVSKHRHVVILSFEKPGCDHQIPKITQRIQNQNITWAYLHYHNRWGLFSTAWQIFRGLRLALKLCKQHHIKVVHTRTLIPAVMAYLIRACRRTPFIFDIRGFILDEKVEIGRLNKHGVTFKLLKKLERHILKKSDHVVTLTHASEQIFISQYHIPQHQISVIPTCVNKALFKPLSAQKIGALKAKLGYTEQDLILIHTGTTVGWFDFESECKLVKHTLEIQPNLKWLILTKDPIKTVEATIKKHEIAPDKISIFSSNLDQVHEYLNIADASLFFYLPAYSMLARAPTKFAENVACLLPSFTNKGVGDMSWYFSHYPVGCEIDLDTLQQDIEKHAQQLANMLKTGKNHNKNTTYQTLLEKHFSHQVAVKQYENIYQQLTD